MHGRSDQQNAREMYRVFICVFVCYTDPKMKNVSHKMSQADRKIRRWRQLYLEHPQDRRHPLTGMSSEPIAVLLVILQP